MILAMNRYEKMLLRPSYNRKISKASPTMLLRFHQTFFSFLESIGLRRHCKDSATKQSCAISVYSGSVLRLWVKAWPDIMFHLIIQYRVLYYIILPTTTTGHERTDNVICVFLCHGDVQIYLLIMLTQYNNVLLIV